MDKSAKNDIVQAIRDAERRTSAEIRVHLKSKHRGDALEEARKIFHKFGMHKTKERNGVLIFVASDSKIFAIYGDSGIHAHAGDPFWQKTRDAMLEYFRRGEIKEGIVASIKSAGEKLAVHFPKKQNDTNELPDNVSGK